MNITFEESFKEDIIKNVLEKDINNCGTIIDRDTKEEVLTQKGESINVKNFGGFKNGSEIFIKNDIVSLMDHLDK